MTGRLAFASRPVISPSPAPSDWPLALALLFRQLRVDRDLDVVADEHTTRLERDVPRETKFAALDLRGGAERGLLVPPRIAGAALILDIQRHRTRNPGDREIARHAETVTAALHLRALER